jgi:hypothetical protein
MRKAKLSLAAFAFAAFGIGASAAPASAMHCFINGQPELTTVCNQVLSIVCNPKVGPCG